MSSILSGPLLAMLPDLTLIGLGALIARWLPVAAWQGLDRLNFQLLFPALLFVAAASRPIQPSDLVTIGLAAWLILGAGFVLGLLLRNYGPENWVDFAGAWQTAWRFNTAMAFVAAQAFPETVSGLLAVAIGMAVPMANILAVGALTRDGEGAGGDRLLEILKNPFLIASSLGVLVGVFQIPIPDVPMVMAERLASAALPLTLLSIGAALDLSRLWRLDRFCAGLHVVKLIVLPAAVLLAANVMNAPKPLCAALILFAALPTASAAHILAARYGADRNLVATIVTQSSVLGCITVPIWSLVLLVWM